MALRIAQLGQPVLRQAAHEVPVAEIAAPGFQQFLRDMHATLAAAQGAGLAGPQVFDGRRVFLAAVLPPVEPEGPPGVETFINPRIVKASPEMVDGWEGCLSFPELLVKVSRAREVIVEYFNLAGEAMIAELSDFPARVIQHEYDHLEGILTLDRACSTRDIIKASEFDAVATKHSP